MLLTIGHRFWAFQTNSNLPYRVGSTHLIYPPDPPTYHLDLYIQQHEALPDLFLPLGMRLRCHVLGHTFNDLWDCRSKSWYTRETKKTFGHLAPTQSLVFGYDAIVGKHILKFRQFFLKFRFFFAWKKTLSHLAPTPSWACWLEAEGEREGALACFSSLGQIMIMMIIMVKTSISNSWNAQFLLLCPCREVKVLAVKCSIAHILVFGVLESILMSLMCLIF